jgi:hypothetical protein
MPYSRITVNIGDAAAGKKRYEYMDGKQYLVVPGTIQTEGVHEGSQGKLLYPGSELGKFPGVWNAKPAVVYHPTANGDGVSACDPVILETQGVGILLKTDCQPTDNKLKTEFWLDENKLRRLAPSTHKSLSENKAVQVSTGLWHDLEATAGVWNGQKYDGIVRNIRPDHVAILPDQQGADKGTGLLVNAADHGLSHNDIKDHLHREHNGASESWESGLPYSERAHIHDVFPKHVVYEKGGKHFKRGYKVKDSKAKFDGEPEEVTRQTTYVTANGEALVRNSDDSGPVKVITKPKIGEMSQEMQRQQFQKNLAEHLAGDQQGGEWGGWVQDVLANHVVWSKDGKLFRLPYTYDNDKIGFAGEPEEVTKHETAGVSEYRRKVGTDGTMSPVSINFEVPGTTINFSLTQREPPMPLTPEQIQAAGNKMFGMLTKTLKVNPADAQKMVQNAIHQGAHELIHEATKHMEAHNAPDKSDSQTRSNAAGARKQEVDKMIGSGKYREEDRQFLSNLPDDDWESIKSNAIKGATQPIVPYSYAGIGDRSNAHTANQSPVDQFLATVPPELQSLLRNSLSMYGQRKAQLIKLITNAKGNRFTELQLKDMLPEALEAIASLIPQPTQNADSYNAQAIEDQLLANNYGGQASTPMFVMPNQSDAAQQTQNQQNQNILPLPDFAWSDKPVQDRA